MEPSDFSILYQDTEAAPYDAGSSGSQTTMNNGRAVVAAATRGARAAARPRSGEARGRRGDLELADGQVRVSARPAKTVSIAELAGSGAPLIGKGSGPVAREPALRRPRAASAGSGSSPSSSRRSSRHAARVKVDRETGVVRVLQVAAAHDSGVIVNRDRRERPGLRRRRHGHRAGAPRDARSSTPKGASAIRTCSTTSSSPPPTPRESTSTGSRRRPRTGARKARRASASRRPSRPPARSRTRSLASSARG